MRLPLAVVASLLLCPALVTGQQKAAKQERAVLEQQVRARAAQITRERLGLTDAQMQQLQRVNSRFGPQLGAVATEERTTRRQLRQEMMADQQADQARVSTLLDASIRLQKQRIALIEAEQKELAAFLTPVQRARYIALQAQFRNRADQLSRQNGGRRNANRRPLPGGARVP